MDMTKTASAAGGFGLDAGSGCFQNMGVDVMAFSDIYPEGHQSGVTIIMHGNRVAANGDIRFEQTPGQWQPVPRLISREPDAAANTITTVLGFPDPSRHLKGHNPMIYPDFEFSYRVTTKAKGRRYCHCGLTACAGEVRRQSLLQPGIVSRHVVREALDNGRQKRYLSRTAQRSCSEDAAKLSAYRQLQPA